MKEKIGTTDVLPVDRPAKAITHLRKYVKREDPLTIPDLDMLTNKAGLFAQLEAQAALVKIRHDSIEPYIEALKDTSGTNWRATAILLSEMGSNAEPAVPVFINSLQSTNLAVQQATLTALRKIHARSDLCIPAMIPFLQSTNSWTRQEAIEGVRVFGCASNHLGVAEITKLLGDPDPEVRRKAARALKQLDPAAAAKAGVK